MVMYWLVTNMIGLSCLSVVEDIRLVVACDENIDIQFG